MAWLAQGARMSLAPREQVTELLGVRDALCAAHPFIARLLVASTFRGAFVHHGRVIVAANDRTAELLGAPDGDSLVGLDWTNSLLPAERSESPRVSGVLPMRERRSDVVWSRDGRVAVALLLDAFRVEHEGHTYGVGFAELLPSSFPEARRRAEAIELAHGLAGVGTWIVDFHRDVLRGTSSLVPSLKELGELPRAAAGDELRQRVHPDDLPHVERFYAALRPDMEPAEITYRVVGEAHRPTWVLARAVGRRDATGAGYVLGVTQDITLLRDANEAEQRFATLFASAPDATLVVGAQGRILHANAAAYRLLGLAALEPGTAVIDDFLPASVRSALAQGLEPAGGGRSVSELTGVVVRVDRTPIAARIALSTALLDGESVALIVLRDLTEADGQRRALRESEGRYRALFEQAADGILLCDGRGLILDANDAACRLLGVERGALLAHDLRESLPLAEPLPSESDEAAHELDVRTHDGKTRRFEVRSKRVRGGTVQLLLRDISERLVAEAALRRVEKLDAVGRLAGGVAHDFNNLLTVILSLTEELERGVEDDAESLEIVGDIRSAAERAGQLTRQLLSFARSHPSVGRKLDLHAEVLAFRRLLERAVGEGIEVRFELASEPLAIVADATDIQQILLNLAINARDATGRRGVIVVRTRLAEALAEIEVEDFGEGMDEEVRAHLFEPFFTTKPPGHGTGLGLATIYGIAKRAGGDIRVRSHVGKGSCFTVSLPLATAGEAPPPSPLPRGRGQTIAVVEPPGASPSIADVLRSGGYRPDVFRDPTHALREISTSRDHALFVVDATFRAGPVLVRELLHLRPELPVVFVAWPSVESGSLSLLGRLVAKPLQPEALLRAVGGVLSDG